MHVIAVRYDDGPTEGFTECSECGRTYSFRKLAWDDFKKVRIFAFAPLFIDLNLIAGRLSPGWDRRTRLVAGPPFGDAESRFIEDLLSQPATHVAAFEGWPGDWSIWRGVAGTNLDTVHDWFSFLGIPRKK